MKDAILTAAGLCAVVYLIGIFALIVGLNNALKARDDEDGQRE